MSNLDKKKAVVLEIKEKLEKSGSVIFCNGRGLSVGQDTKLRKDLREANVEYKVYKNTLVNLAIQDTPFQALDAYLAGPTTIAFSYEDPIVAARIIGKHRKDVKALEFKAGVVESIAYDAAGIDKISNIPSTEVLQSKLLGSFKAPMASFVRLMNAIKESLEEKNMETAEVVDAPAAETSAEVATEPVAVEAVTEEAVAEVATETPEASAEVATEAVVAIPEKSETETEKEPEA